MTNKYNLHTAYTQTYINRFSLEQCASHICAWKNISNLVQKDTELDPPQSIGTKNLHFFPTRQCVGTKSSNKKQNKNKKNSEIGSPLQNTRRLATLHQLQQYLENSSTPEKK